MTSYRFSALTSLVPALAAALAFLAPVPSHAAETGARWVLQDQNHFPDPEVFVVAMISDDQGTKWFATKKGLVRLSILGDWQTFSVENTSRGLASNAITALALGQNRELWVATEGGVSWYANGSWKTFTRENTAGGLPDNFVTSLAIGRDERWFGTKSGFAMLRGSSWTTYAGDKISGRLPHKMVTAIALDSAGDKWIGTIAGLVRFSGSSWNLVTRDNSNGGLPHNSITYLAVAPDNVKWVATQTGLARLAPGTSFPGAWTSFKAAADLGEIASEQIYSLAVEKSGTVWLAAKGGAAAYDGSSWRLYNKNNTSAIQTRFIYSVMPVAEGEVWFGTQKGVVQRVPVQED